MTLSLIVNVLYSLSIVESPGILFKLVTSVQNALNDVGIHDMNFSGVSCIYDIAHISSSLAFLYFLSLNNWRLELVLCLCDLFLFFPFNPIYIYIEKNYVSLLRSL